MRLNGSINWKVGGPAGEGVMSTGLIFSKTCSRHGLKIFDYTEYPSLITGGHNTYQVYASPSGADAQFQLLDVLVAFDKPTLDLHPGETTDHTVIIFDASDDGIVAAEHALPGQKFDLPMVRLATEVGGSRVMANNVALGASVYLFGLDLEVLNSVIADVFGRKGKEVVEKNQASAKAGYDYAVENFGQPVAAVSKVADKSYLTMTGNEAISLGAIAGGLQFYAAYPMTPSSSILHYLAAKAPVADIVVKHAEDEISAINMALGANFAGVRAMTGSSGGGFSYMTEALGLSGVAEIPLVVVESMRPGPALGMPTWTAQGDLLFILTASQDEFPRFVLAPGDAQEAFYMSRLALELSEKYQTLTMLVSDKYLSESRYTLEINEVEFKNERHGLATRPQKDVSGFYKRYEVTESGVTDRSIPGQVGGEYICNSYEHDEFGFSTEEGSVRVEQMNKRNKKMDAMRGEILPQFFEDSGGAMTLVGFGSTKGVLLEAKRILQLEGIAINILNLSWLWPFPSDQVLGNLSREVPFAVVEGNSYGQLAKVMKMETGLETPHHLRKYDGRPFYPHEVVDFVKKTLGK